MVSSWARKSENFSSVHSQVLTAQVITCDLSFIPAQYQNSSLPFIMDFRAQKRIEKEKANHNIPIAQRAAKLQDLHKRMRVSSLKPCFVPPDYFRS